MATFMEYWFKQGKEVEAMECYDRSVVANKLLIYSETGDALLKILLKYGQKTHAWALYHDMLHRYGTDEAVFGHLCSSTVEIMVNECFDMGRCGEAIDTYNKARAKSRFLAGKYISTTTWTTLINAYLNSGRTEDAIKTSNKMIDATLEEVSHLF